MQWKKEMKFAHISDLHVNNFYRHSHFKEVKAILKYCKAINVDHILITGDLTDNASEFNLQILQKSLAKYGYENSSRLSVVPGNHDIYGGLQKAEDIFSFPDRCKQTDYNTKVKNFNKIFSKSFEECIYTGKFDFYPYAKLIDGVLLIGINSNAYYSTISNPFASNGEVSPEQFLEVEKILQEYGKLVKYRIVLIHHHFNKIKNNSGVSSAGLWQNIEKQTMKLRKKKRLITLFKEHNIDLILHGHLHLTQTYEKKGLIFINSGGSIKDVSTNKLKFNIINVDKNSIRTEIHKISVQDYQNAGNVRPVPFDGTDVPLFEEVV